MPEPHPTPFKGMSVTLLYVYTKPHNPVTHLQKGKVGLAKIPHSKENNNQFTVSKIRELARFYSILAQD